MNLYYISIGSIIAGLIFIVIGFLLTPVLINFPTDKKFKINQSNLCVSNEPTATEEKSKIILKECNNDLNQEFTYDITGQLLKNQNRNLCIEDGMGSSSNYYKLNTCDSTNKLQKFSYEPKDKRIVRVDGEQKSCAVNMNNMLTSGPCSDGMQDQSRQFNINTIL
jgi:hypothetical protein